MTVLFTFTLSPDKTSDHQRAGKCQTTERRKAYINLERLGIICVHCCISFILSIAYIDWEYASQSAKTTDIPVGLALLRVQFAIIACNYGKHGGIILYFPLPRKVSHVLMGCYGFMRNSTPLFLFPVHAFQMMWFILRLKFSVKCCISTVSYANCKKRKREKN